MMGSPYEELEYLANYLPDEGESVVVTRRSGELVCERPSSFQERCQPDSPPPRHADEIEHREFDGRLIQADARLRRLAVLPIWVCATASFWTCLLLHTATELASWAAFCGVLFVAIPTTHLWIRVRRSKLFKTELRAMLAWQLRRWRLDRFATMSNIQGRRDLRLLQAEMTRWIES
ncbi:MAG: hypothetical protein O3A00_18920 [Planctomycetota bacterium]|nr:hypothetical protein [Planctomycetota bacterium]